MSWWHSPTPASSRCSGTTRRRVGSRVSARRGSGRRACGAFAPASPRRWLRSPSSTNSRSTPRPAPSRPPALTARACSSALTEKKAGPQTTTRARRCAKKAAWSSGRRSPRRRVILFGRTRPGLAATAGRARASSRSRCWRATAKTRRASSRRGGEPPPRGTRKKSETAETPPRIEKKKKKKMRRRKERRSAPTTPSATRRARARRARRGVCARCASSEWAGIDLGGCVRPACVCRCRERPPPPPTTPTPPPPRRDPTRTAGPTRPRAPRRLALTFSTSRPLPGTPRSALRTLAF
mmetsp:Transcript_5567/g.23529  ORF Transcript_5567/g.23529 Transcript_5567/m.23529 type:complete len:295 (-) Transcript_5567:2276-3160(-)